ncbi:MAG: DUF1080 domain-containing protein [Opitutaceae bacterium]|jgi:alpha-L-arabinofuranosidase|nr:DUF1080 domain-containing protein [Opitutaceae bacterium]
MTHRARLLSALAVPLVALALPSASAAPVTVTVDAAAPGIPVSPLMHGVFFEDINYGADGGLYAELVQNRSFEHADPFYAWGLVNRGADASAGISTEAPLNPNNPHFLRLAVRDPGEGFGVANHGFGGIAVRAGENYLVSLRARAANGFSGALAVAIEDETGRVLGRCRVENISTTWVRRDAVIAIPPASASRLPVPFTGTGRARLVVTADAAGTIDLDVISLFPENTWKQRPNGLRADLVQMLADMRPGFLRFPGGCIVEGDDLANAYRWKDTVGDIAARPENRNRWQHALHRDHAPQYYQSYGLGFFEYFQLCEDIGAAPVPVINCGMACQYQTGELVPLGELGPFVRDALDLVEFANGPVDSKWGGIRAAMGHPAPFNLKHLGIGNEQWGEQYFERYTVFHDALKTEHPEIVLITTSGPGVDDPWWRLAWDKFKAGTPAEIVDEHYYRPPAWFFAQADRYDRHDRAGPKVFAGEFAAHETDRRNTLRAALSEAAFMTGLLRNADVVTMAAYAPLFAKSGATQWAPDLVWFDHERVYGTPSYHVQKAFSRHRPDRVLPTTLAAPPQPAPAYPGSAGVGTWHSRAEFKDFVITHGGRELFRADFANEKQLAAWQTRRGAWAIRDGALRQENPDEPDVRALAVDGAWTDYTLSVKARKLGGEEGFLVFFQAEPGGETGRLNLGAYRNTQYTLNLGGAPAASAAGRIEDGRWYDIRVEVTGGAVKCRLDGALILEGARRPPAPLYAVAGRDDRAGEIILHLVNPADYPLDAAIVLEGAQAVADTARVSMLTAGSLDDTNTLDAPVRVFPCEEAVAIPAPRFRHTVPARSHTVLRVQAK